MKKRLSQSKRFAWCVFTLWACAAIAVPGSGKKPAPSSAVPAIPEGHPRVYVRPADMPAVRAKLDMPEFAKSWNVVQKGAVKGYTGEAGPMCGAFLYLVKGDREQGLRAVEGALADLQGSLDATNAARTLVSPMHYGACVYDWCYDLLSESQKRAFIKEFERIAAMHSPGYPARAPCLAVVGHDSEGWLLSGQLQAGVAIHDESPAMYDAAATLFFETFVPPRNYHYAGHSHHQGSHYNTRLVYDLSAAWLFRRLGAGDVFSRDLQFVPYEDIYCMRPDGGQLRRGDASDDGRSGRKRAIMILAAAYYEDPFLFGLVTGNYFDRQCSPMEDIFDLLFRPAGLASRSISGLPTAKAFPEPMGDLVARSGWAMGADSRDVLVHMRIGGTFFGNHQRLDMGTFQIFYRGPLAVPSGSYKSGYGDPHWRYAHNTLASNGLLILDPNEHLPKGQIRTGGQVIPNKGKDHPTDLETILSKGYEQGDVTGQAFGPDPMRPEYAFIAGDITRAYGPKAEQVTRSMATLFTGNSRYPAVLVVFDRVTASQPEFKKTWLLHSFEEPTLAEDSATVAYTGGKLNVQSILPDAAEIRKIGGPGREFWVENAATNYAPPPRVKLPEACAWRIEISPRQAQKTDTFLTALTVMDAADMTAPEVRRIESTDTVGVACLDRAVLFSRDVIPSTRVTFTLDGSAATRVLVCGLAGGHWRVLRDGQEQQTRLPVPSSSGSLYFQGRAGQHILERTDIVEPPPIATFWDRSRAERKEASCQTPRPQT